MAVVEYVPSSVEEKLASSAVVWGSHHLGGAGLASGSC